MHNFKKAIVATISFLLLLALGTAIVVYPYWETEALQSLDREQREMIAGSIDTIMIGASHAMAALSPQILDSERECNSYNMSNTMMTIHARTVILEKELARNPVDTVILELSYNALTRDQSEDGANGDAVTAARLDSTGERMKFMRKYVTWHTLTDFYSRTLVEGMSAWKDVISNRSLHNIDYSLKGFHPTNAVDQSFSPDEARDKYQNGPLITEYRQENISEFQELVDLCKSYDTRVIVVVVPVSDNILWNLSDWDKFKCFAEAFCEENNCEFYDLNLLKNRNEIFNIRESFSDDIHMSEEGGIACTHQLAEILTRVDEGADVSDLFVDTYVEAIDNLPYNQCLN